MSTSHLRFRRKLGDALYGEVMECELHHSAPHYPNLPRMIHSALQERRVAHLLASSGGHRNVVASYFHFQEHQCLYLVGEFCNDGDLYTHLTSHTRNGVMDEQSSVHVMTQIFHGIDYLHRVLGIAHRDLSLENVLLHDGECKISDFGLSVDAATRCKARVGKEYYMAPEVVAGKTNDPHLVIWSLGVMWFILLTGTPLVPLASPKVDSFLAFQRCGLTIVFESWGLASKLSPWAVDLLSRMLTVNPSKRISLKEILTRLSSQ